jgi:hypothetical protein|tara:strand:- start:67 stop:309 length:243 start_codon:yes stop_codon:yes gene_type:complete
MTTTYKSKNFDKRLAEWCAENRKEKAIRKSLNKEQREQLKKDLKFVSNFVKQTLINQNNQLTKMQVLNQMQFMLQNLGKK